MIKALLVVVMALAAWPSAADGQEPDPRLRDRLDEHSLAMIAEIVDSAGRDELPVEPLVQKALEGLSKGADDAVIVRAVRALAVRLRQAADVLGPRAATSELVATADAIYMGVEPATLQEMVRARSDGPLAVPLVVLTDLIRRGVSRDTASEVILSLVRARVDEDDMTIFRQQVERDIGMGAPPSTAAATRARGLLIPRQPGVPP